MNFIITTTKEVAEQIEKQCAYDEKQANRSYKLGKIEHHEGYSNVQIQPKNEKIKAEDIFWLGYLSSIWSKSVCVCNSDKYGFGFAKCFACGKVKDF